MSTSDWFPTEWTRIQNDLTLRVEFDANGDRVRWGDQRAEWHWRVTWGGTTMRSGSEDTKETAMAHAMQAGLEVERGVE